MTIFIHGLNTYDDDIIHVGPLTFGPMHAAWESEFRKRGLEMVAVTGLLAGSPEDQAAHALKFIEQNRILEKTTGPVHIVGQSIGGLAGRVMATDPRLSPRLQSLITVGTPHLGTASASLGLDFERRHPILTKFVSAAGYDPRKRAAIYRHFTPEAIAEFNRRYPPPAAVQEVSFLCQVRPADIALPLLPMYFDLHPKDSSGQRPASDGLILCDSQRRGEVKGPFAVDHMAQLGVFIHGLPQQRMEMRLEFERLVGEVCDYIRS
jgi:pimeloyl-ACP methyl ester carboxylesterase